MASSIDVSDVVLEYTIHSCSSFSGDFLPKLILTDDPTNPKSRWLSSDNRMPQFIVLKLEQPSVVKSILFGKFDKSHPCNLRKFRIYGGMDPDHLHLLLEDGLSNDSTPETFGLQFRQKQDVFPCQYIKIVPLLSWGHSFNFSIWHVQLRGSTDKKCVTAAVQNFQRYCEREAVRICLKHLREYDYDEAFEALQKKAKVSLEHPLLTQLHKLLVVEGDFESVEKLIKQAAKDGYLDEYISEQPINAQWRQLQPNTPHTATDQAVSVDVGGWPMSRGGHQLCLDPTSQTIYLYGGWDGSKDLADLWTYDIQNGVWTCLFQDTSLVQGPSGRSCHKMCLDVHDQTLYLLGQYVDRHPVRALLDLSGVMGDSEADFYSYSIKSKTWDLISSDTYSDGGPKLIFDHQMCFDQNTKSLYVFGGKVLSNPFMGGDSGTSYSGLYVYHVTDQQWMCLRPDLTSEPYKYSLVPRMSHSMVIDPDKHLLYILGGQRDKQQLSDMLMYDFLSDCTTVIANGNTTQVPASGFTVRITLNSKKTEICLFASKSKLEDRENRQVSKTCTNSLWIYELTEAKWKCILQGKQQQSSVQVDSIPIPRFAHQFVYDPSKDVHYMFGGNPGGSPSKTFPINMRLDDFWQLKFVSLTEEKLTKHCQYIIRKQRFSELAISSPVEAISYLQVQLAVLVNHDNKQESDEFRELAGTVFTSSADDTVNGVGVSSSSERSKLYTELSSYFPSHMTQPEQNITDLVRL